MSETYDPAAEVPKISACLTAIVDMHQRLLTQAIHHAADREMPGGTAMVMLGPVGDRRRWDERFYTLEHAWLEGESDEDPYAYVWDDDADDEPPLATLAYWSDFIREQRGESTRLRATVEREADYLRSRLTWAADDNGHGDPNLLEFPLMDDALRSCRARLETVLIEGVRLDRGAPCLQCESTLERVTHARRSHDECEGHDRGHGPVCPYPQQGCCDRGGGQEWFRCRKCQRTYDEASYRLAVAAAFRAHAPALTAADIELTWGVKASLVRLWGSRGHVAKRGKDRHGITLYDVEQVRQRHAGAGDVA